MYWHILTPCSFSTYMYLLPLQLITTSTPAPDATSWRFHRRRMMMRTSPSRPIVGFRRFVGGHVYVQPSLGPFGFWPYSVVFAFSMMHDVLLDPWSLRWCNNYQWRCMPWTLYLCLSLKFIVPLPVVENPTATRVRVSCVGGLLCASNLGRTRKRPTRVSTISGALQLGIRAGLTVGPFTGRSRV